MNEPFRLSAEDSGTPDAPITYQASPGAEVRLFGGVALDPRAARPVRDPDLIARLRPEARAHVVRFDLAKTGAALPPPLPAVFEDNGGLFSLIQDDRKLPLARWPREGYATIAEVLDSGISPPRGGTFRYRGDHPAAWKTAARSGALWLTGFWRVPFVAQSVKVAAVDEVNRVITLASPVSQGIGSKYTPLVNGTRRGDGKEPYYAFNLPEEISAPGDWCYDHARRALLLWPSETRGLEGLRVSLLDRPIVQLTDVARVTLNGFRIEGGSAGAVRIEGGEQVALLGLCLRNVGGIGVDVAGGRGHTIRACDFEHVGQSGIRVVAGDRKALTPGQVVVENNHIAFVGEEARISPAIVVGGVGQRIRNNLIHDAPNAGVVYQGNDHLIELNEIHHVGLDSGDLGGIYTNGDWAGLGNVVRHNLIHSSPGANGVYIDDGASGHTVEENIFFRLASGPFIGGGHANLVTGNLVVDCRLGVHLDDRGVSRGYGPSAPHLGRFLKQVDVSKPPWSTRYKPVLSVLERSGGPPTGDVIRDNIIIAAIKPFDIAKTVALDLSSNRVYATDPGLKNPAGFDFSPAADRRSSPDLAPIARLPLDRIGLYKDALRPSLPNDLDESRRAARKPRILFDSRTDIDASNHSP
ncbi:right-handed parallel beta-helix repeat-containing protein [uncultured Caulobacter sp.]|uniref:right-handed parallel beta-helix repeat-containing protein n=1 Tax=uncultured Caulobacter sp. TaxID=158749 RepID=UPI002626A10E|nr:right-handed parallel beta-helix repeat-containing protein [uncultured Caulobacter sp.]